MQCFGRPCKRWSFKNKKMVERWGGRVSGAGAGMPGGKVVVAAAAAAVVAVVAVVVWMDGWG